MPPEFEFDAEIVDAGGGGAFVRIPFDVEQAFGKKRVPILAEIDGQPYHGTLVRMGEPCHMLLILKEIRTRIGKSIGQSVHIRLREDTEERRVEIPPDLLSALQSDPPALRVFEKLSYTHQKEHVQAILSARQAETRARRIQKALEMLNAVKKG